MKHTLFVVLACLAACGGNDPDTITMSGAGFYEELFTADCQSGVRCGLLDPSLLETCIDGETQLACESDLQACSRTYTVDADEWETCVQETEDRACASVENGILPSECLVIDELF